jgi:hypothetical protein
MRNSLLARDPWLQDGMITPSQFEQHSTLDAIRVNLVISSK